MSSPKNIRSPVSQQGQREILREITGTLHNSTPVKLPRRKSAIDTTLAKEAESDVKVQYSQEFVEGSNTAVPESPSSTSSVLSRTGIVGARKLEGDLRLDSISNSPSGNFDRSYVNVNVPGLDDLISACADINLNDKEEELKDLPISEISQDQSFESAFDASVLQRVERDFDSTITFIGDEEGNAFKVPSENKNELERFETCQALSGQEIRLNTEVKVSNEKTECTETKHVIEESSLETFKTCQEKPAVENFKRPENNRLAAEADINNSLNTYETCQPLNSQVGSEEEKKILSTKTSDDKSENVTSDIANVDNSIQSFKTCQLLAPNATIRPLEDEIVSSLHQSSKVASPQITSEEVLPSYKTCLPISPDETLQTYKTCLPSGIDENEVHLNNTPRLQNSPLNQNPPDTHELDAIGKSLKPDNISAVKFPEETVRSNVLNPRTSEVGLETVNSPFKTSGVDTNKEVLNATFETKGPECAVSPPPSGATTQCLNATFETQETGQTLNTTFSPQKTDAVLNTTFETQDIVTANTNVSRQETGSVSTPTLSSQSIASPKIFDTEQTISTLPTTLNHEIGSDLSYGKTFVKKKAGLDLNTTFDSNEADQVSEGTPEITKKNVESCIPQPTSSCLLERFEPASTLEKVNDHSPEQQSTFANLEQLDSTISINVADLDDDSYDLVAQFKSELKPVENDVNIHKPIVPTVPTVTAQQPYFKEAYRNLSIVPESSKENAEDISDISPPKVEEAAILSPETTSPFAGTANTFENAFELDYERFQPRKESTSLRLPNQADIQLLEEAAQAVAKDIETSFVEDGDDQFVAASDEFFADPTFLDDLLNKSDSNSKSRDLRFVSLYAKFDPLVGKQNMLPQGDTPQPEEEHKKETADVPVLQTPKKNPALAAIDRLLFYSPMPTSAALDTEESKVEKEAPKPCAQEVVPVVDETMAKELELVRSTVLQLEEQIEQMKKEHKEQIEKQRNEFQLQLSQETKCKNQMTVVVEEYEKSISRLLADREKDRATYEQEKLKFQEELQATNNHLTNTEAAFNDVHSKYERLKGVVSAFKSNESILKESIQENEETIKALEKRYDQLKSHAMAQLEKANLELSTIRKHNDAENMKLRALVRRAELKSKSLEETVEQKTKENKELTQIIDEMIERVD